MLVMDRVMALAVAGSALLLAYLIWRSLGWPLVHDAPLMHYVAWLIAQGGVPYRDAFDMNLPGPYLIHWAVLALAGPGDLAWRLFDLAWLSATGALVFAYCRPVGDGWAAAGAVTLFGVYHLSGGAWRLGQRDFLLGLFLLAGAWGVARSAEQGGAMAPLLWAGLALGAGMMVKPHAGLYWAGCALVAARGARRAGRPALARGAAVLGAGLVAPGLALGWLGWRGGLGELGSILAGYVLPLYSQVGRATLPQALAWYVYGWQSWALLLALGLLAALTPAPRALGPRKTLALLGAGYGLAHFFLQGKGWEYQLYPLALFVCALAPFALASAGRPAPRAPRAPGVRRALALGLFAGTVMVLGAKGVEAREPSWVADKVRRVAAVTRALAALVPPGERVQVMDVTEGGLHALLNLGLRQPTRFLYDFHFFHDPGDPRVGALRAEFARGLEARPPAALVVFEDGWIRKGYGRLDDFPEVARLLGRAYAVAAEGQGYRIYAKRRGP
jgi:hypothetical protein